MSPFDLSVRFFLQLAVVLAACRMVGLIARRFGQPQVVAEMISGVLLGPSVFGLLSTKAVAAGWLAVNPQAWLFPKESKVIFFAVSQIGLAMYMFLVGVEFRADLFQSKIRSAISVSVAGMLAPFLLGAALGVWLIQTGGFFSPKVQSWEALLFLGASMCITAFPMLARIIVDRGLAGTSLGTLALAAGAIDDVAAWCVLALVLASFKDDWHIAAWAIGGGTVYAASVLTVGKRWLARLEPMTVQAGGPCSRSP